MSLHAAAIVYFLPMTFSEAAEHPFQLVFFFKETSERLSKYYKNGRHVLNNVASDELH